MTDLAYRPAATEQPGSDAAAPAGPWPVRRLPWVLLTGAAVGFVAAFVLLVEKIALLEDPDYVPSCSINPILSCGSIMKTPQAEVFGFPNPIIGVAGFAALATIAVVLLAGATLPGWFWAGIQAGVTFGVVFIHWLIFQSLYRIDALCPYCMVVWTVMIPVFWYTTLANLQRWGTSRSERSGVAGGLIGFHGAGLTAWYLLIVGLVAQRFWDYWSTLLP